MPGVSCPQGKKYANAFSSGLDCPRGTGRAMDSVMPEPLDTAPIPEPGDDSAPLEPVVSGERVIDVPSVQPGEEPESKQIVVANALRFADNLAPILAAMALDPLLEFVACRYRFGSDKRRIPCCVRVVLSHGREVEELEKRDPLKVVLYSIGRTFPSLLVLSTNEAVETVVTILFGLNALVLIGASVAEGFAPLPVEPSPPAEATEAPVETPAPKAPRKRRSRSS